MNKKLVAIIEGALLIVIGVLAAVFGGGQVMDIVFGVLFVVGGAALGALACATTVKTKILPLNMMATAVGFLFFGILLLAKLPSHYVTTVSPVIHYAMIAAAGLGVALFIKGLHVLIAKKIVFTGIGQMVIGAAVAAVAIVYIFVPSFYDVFWIIMGILIAVGGLYTCLMGFFGKEAK